MRDVEKNQTFLIIINNLIIIIILCDEFNVLNLMY